MRKISSVAELEKVIEEAARRTMEGASKDILTLFKKNYVTEYAYVKGAPVKYPQTFDFRESWIWSDIEKHASTLSIEMFSDWTKMKPPSSRGKTPFRHTTFEKSRWVDDARPFMDAILNDLPNSWLTGDRIGGYWTKFVEKELNAGKLKKIIDRHARRNGLNPVGMSIS